MRGRMAKGRKVSRGAGMETGCERQCMRMVEMRGEGRF